MSEIEKIKNKKLKDKYTKINSFLSLEGVIANVMKIQRG
jgi:hypothetical protein